MRLDTGIGTHFIHSVHYRKISSILNIPKRRLGTRFYSLHTLQKLVQFFTFLWLVNNAMQTTFPRHSDNYDCKKSSKDGHINPA